jgi:hypothetical protein
MHLEEPPARSSAPIRANDSLGRPGFCHSWQARELARGSGRRWDDGRHPSGRRWQTSKRCARDDRDDGRRRWQTSKRCAGPDKRDDGRHPRDDGRHPSVARVLTSIATSYDRRIIQGAELVVRPPSPETGRLSWCARNSIDSKFDKCARSGRAAPNDEMAEGEGRHRGPDRCHPTGLRVEPGSYRNASRAADLPWNQRLEQRGASWRNEFQRPAACLNIRPKSRTVSTHWVRSSPSRSRIGAR